MEKWTETDSELKLTLKFKDFKVAWAFMNQVAIAAEELKHHPNWANVYNSVEIVLTTHDEGNTLTKKDYELAAAINDILNSYDYKH
ncbi:4a-hydroxytetrahydrobiopterin dehydratase [Salibacteraceae bacterium]|jgi:4a-hydroxytetrahydrobiopterin dehydratase|nr:pterin-4-alpha-carbinolamine dehydratase [Crocinitomicaceae bacterium]MCH9822405.1 4a-hydroxytetrahydrobiopterin dehydratase [Bacteroidota bacterium]MDA7730395.1 4a-hydroxytetrahydrobiopterin dehydratase [Salibacteraceae bacterium]MDB0058393.1 4a-hydroxytetrahydrobiopterin dehydratase [Salibacteraceae bacterium]MDB9725865.1 4a-hydroxytetrahydrobiopterin dehydratase [Salibacteraceae bacterium]|tara:strand:+ start:137878 stop:138135 length:258 start_codon:yes stop_codon:yes gene_type:complete